jgi:hypothetical protein
VEVPSGGDYRRPLENKEISSAGAILDVAEDVDFSKRAFYNVDLVRAAKVTTGVR